MRFPLLTAGCHDLHKTFCLSFLCIILLSLVASLARAMHQRDSRQLEGWWSARRDSAGIAPNARQNAGLAIVRLCRAYMGLERRGGSPSVDHF